MAWTDPDTLTASVADVYRAADVNAILDNLKYLYDRPHCVVRLTATQDVANSSDHLILWDEAARDTTGGLMWDAGSPGVIMFPIPGRYLIIAHELWAEGPSGDRSKRAMFVERDGAVRLPGMQVANVNPSEFSHSLETNIGEDSYIEFTARQLSGGTLALQPNMTRVTVTWLAPFQDVE